MSAEKRGETDGPFVRISLTFLVSAVNLSPMQLRLENHEPKLPVYAELIVKERPT